MTKPSTSPGSRPRNPARAGSIAEHAAVWLLPAVFLGVLALVWLA